jgi:Lar family restriction alleviation protein
MSEIKLKPCPFCGSHNVHLFPGYYNYADCIVCTNCKAKFQTDKYMTDEQMSEAWNKRAYEEASG